MRGDNLGFDLSQIQQVFITECNDLLVEMEESLLKLDADSSDVETINQLFRAAHTIKGSAGLFSFNDIVSFTHNVETVLGRVRDGEMSMTADLVAIMLLCRDHIQGLVEVAGLSLSAEMAAEGNKLTVGLYQFDSSVKLPGDGKAPAPADLVKKADKVVETSGPVTSPDAWYISIRFGRDVLRNGMDPQSTLQYLRTMGSVLSIKMISDAMPPANEFDPESCYIGFEIQFSAGDGVTKADISGAFDFVREDSAIHVFPPKSAVLDVIKVIQTLPEGDIKIGDILVECGILTRKDLNDALEIQKREKNHPSVSGNRGDVRPIGQILVEEGIVEKSVIDAAVIRQLGSTPQASSEKAQAANKDAKESKFIRVDAEKLDQLINLVGELVIAGASTDLLSKRLNDEELMESASTVRRLVGEIRDSALNMRMVQIGATFSRFQRVVRDISRSLGKDVELVITGAEAELDKSVVEKIADPLMHLVRNSMDHGIEKTEDRIAQGKSEKSELRLNAYHDSGSIVIEVGDDGGGLNTEKIIAKAIAKGLVPAGAQLSDREIHKLIFEPGFSTADAVTDISGRGVGMDVVRRNIEALRGTIEIDSERHVGTTIRIRLPLTLAIIEGFLVGVGRSSYVIPLDMVIECVDMHNSESKSGSDGSDYINMRGEVLPFIRMRERFGHMKDAEAKRENIVVVSYAGRKAGLVVDFLMGETQAVIKPMGSIFSDIRGIGGSTILGTGEVALVVDVQDLMALAVSDDSGKLGAKSALKRMAV